MVPAAEMVLRVLFLVAAWSIYAVDGQANTTHYSQYEYTFVPRAATWALASSTCAGTYQGYLASIHSVEEQLYIMDAFVNSQDVSKFPIQVPSIYPGNDHVTHRGVWIGLRTDVQIGGAWADNTTVDYTNWIDGKPDNYKSQEGCVQIYVDTDQEGWAGSWDDLSCLAAMPYLCKKYVGFRSAYTPITFQGFDYIWHATPTTFDAAEDVCRKTDNGYLVSIATQAELNFLTSAFFSGQPPNDFQVILPNNTYPADYSLKGLWIGLAQATPTSTFSWLDANTTKFTAWADNTPDNFTTRENCTHIYLDELPDTWFGRWNDVSCKSKMGFICKRRALGNGTNWDNSTITVPTLALDDGNSTSGVALDITATNSPGKKQNHTKSYIIVGVVAGTVLLALLLCLTCRMVGRRQRNEANKALGEP